LSGPQNQHFNYAMRSTYNSAQNALHTHTHTQIFENELFPTKAVQQRQRVDAVGWGVFLSELTSMFVFDILQIPSGCFAPHLLSPGHVPASPLHIQPLFFMRCEFQWNPDVV
jgi:hypothetical protein